MVSEEKERMKDKIRVGSRAEVEKVSESQVLEPSNIHESSLSNTSPMLPVVGPGGKSTERAASKIPMSQKISSFISKMNLQVMFKEDEIGEQEDADLNLRIKPKAIINSNTAIPPHERSNDKARAS